MTCETWRFLLREEQRALGNDFTTETIKRHRATRQPEQAQDNKKCAGAGAGAGTSTLEPLVRLSRWFVDNSEGLSIKDFASICVINVVPAHIGGKPNEMARQQKTSGTNTEGTGQALALARACASLA